MNFHNCSICPMIMKFCGECPDTLRLQGKIFFLLFDTFEHDFLIMLESTLLACEFLCREFLWVNVAQIFTVASLYCVGSPVIFLEFFE
jgi:hypothetical protein